MEYESYKELFVIEDFHWWLVGNQRIILKILNEKYNKECELKILDAGCGTGGLMKSIEDRGIVIGLDLSKDALMFARRKMRSPLVRANVQILPFKNDSFDFVLSNDVIYHLNVFDDFAAIKEHERILKQDGKLFIRVAALDWLYGEHDRRVHTGRRYTKQKLENMINEAGLQIEFCSYSNFLLFPFVVLKRIGERLLRLKSIPSDLVVLPSFINKTLTWVLLIEAVVMKKINLPFGSSIICLAKK